MNKRIVLILLLIVLVVLWVWRTNTKSKQSNSLPSLLVSREDSVLTEPQELLTTSINQAPLIQPAVKTKQETIKYNHEAMSFLDWYHQYRWAWVCNVYWYWQSKVDDKLLSDQLLETAFLEHYEVRTGGLGTYADEYIMPQAQKEVLHAYAQRCDRVLSLVADIAPYSNEPIRVLWQLLKESETENSTEQTIQELLRMQDTMHNNHRLLNDMWESEDTWSEQEIIEAWDKVNTYFDMMISADAAQKKALRLKIDAIRAELVQQKVQYAADIVTFIAVLKKDYARIDGLLSSRAPEVFYLAKNLAERSDGFGGLGAIPNGIFEGHFVESFQVAQVTPSERLWIELGMLGNHATNWGLSIAAGILYYCTLGADCQADGLLMTQLCLGLTQDMNSHHSACGKDYFDYLFGVYLTEGQAEDVRLLLAWMEVFYGS